MFVRANFVNIHLQGMRDRSIIRTLKMSASRNQEEEEQVSYHSLEVFQDVTRRVKDVYDILNRETNRVRKEMDAHDEPAKKLGKNPFPKILKLNVGGHIYSTSLATLHNAPSGNVTEISHFQHL